MLWCSFFSGSLCYAIFYSCKWQNWEICWHIYTTHVDENSYAITIHSESVIYASYSHSICCCCVSCMFIAYEIFIFQVRRRKGAIWYKCVLFSSSSSLLSVSFFFPVWAHTHHSLFWSAQQLFFPFWVLMSVCVCLSLGLEQFPSRPIDHEYENQLSYRESYSDELNMMAAWMTPLIIRRKKTCFVTAKKVEITEF